MLTNYSFELELSFSEIHCTITRFVHCSSDIGFGCCQAYKHRYVRVLVQHISEMQLLRPFQSPGYCSASFSKGLKDTMLSSKSNANWPFIMYFGTYLVFHCA
ncbi:hypothetical protein QVD99_002606 [Batrachochytrium dendrobatidis]|nr:hypothetical protein QVD99_002606 [Batrachochytrium dendrobatidis]